MKGQFPGASACPQDTAFLKTVHPTADVGRLMAQPTQAVHTAEKLKSASSGVTSAG